MLLLDMPRGRFGEQGLCWMCARDLSLQLHAHPHCHTHPLQAPRTWRKEKTGVERPAELEETHQQCHSAACWACTTVQQDKAQ